MFCPCVYYVAVFFPSSGDKRAGEVATWILDFKMTLVRERGRDAQGGKKRERVE